MSYSKIDDLLNEFNPDDLARLTGDPSGQQINVVRVDYARELAEAIIDAHLTGRYITKQYDPPDALLKAISVDLTVYNIFQFSYARTLIPNTIIWRRMNAMELLIKLQKGEISLDSQYGNEDSPPVIRTNKSNVERTFTETLLDKFSGED